jgi:hypothetical protein
MRATDQAAQVAAFGEFERYLWTFLPDVPLGQFDVDNAWRANISRMPEGAVSPPGSHGTTAKLSAAHERLSAMLVSRL